MKEELLWRGLLKKNGGLGLTHSDMEQSGFAETSVGVGFEKEQTIGAIGALRLYQGFVFDEVKSPKASSWMLAKIMALRVYIQRWGTWDDIALLRNFM